MRKGAVQYSAISSPSTLLARTRISVPDDLYAGGMAKYAGGMAKELTHGRVHASDNKMT
jgi:hypothetical protein